MILLEIAMTILAIGVVIVISAKFFWFAALILLYRTISSFFTYEFFSDKLGIDNHFIYFILIMSISVGAHFLIITFTNQLVILKFVLYIILLFWVLYKYDLREVFLLKDWFEKIGVEFSIKWFKDQFTTLIKTSPDVYLDYIVGFFNNVAGAIENMFKKLSGSN